MKKWKKLSILLVSVCLAAAIVGCATSSNEDTVGGESTIGTEVFTETTAVKETPIETTAVKETMPETTDIDYEGENENSSNAVLDAYLGDWRTSSAPVFVSIWKDDSNIYWFGIEYFTEKMNVYIEAPLVLEEYETSATAESDDEGNCLYAGLRFEKDSYILDVYLEDAESGNFESFEYRMTREGEPTEGWNDVPPAPYEPNEPDEPITNSWPNSANYSWYNIVNAGIGIGCDEDDNWYSYGGSDIAIWVASEKQWFSEVTVLLETHLVISDDGINYYLYDFVDGEYVRQWGFSYHMTPNGFESGTVSG